MAAKRAGLGSANRSGKTKAASAATATKKPSRAAASPPAKAMMKPTEAAKQPTAAVKAAPAKAVKKPAKASQGGAAPPEVGDAAPEFRLPDHAGVSVTSAELAGAPYVLYFYPKDDTPGCTREARDFQEEMNGFAAAGVRVIGVSPDSSERHARFRAKHGLGFSLLSDAERALAEAYGVWVMKHNYGRQYMGIQRSTFLVGADGRLQRVWRNVRVNGHVSQVLEAIR